MSITAFAAENETNITAEITAADFGYTMVIPTTTTLTEANHENVLLGTDGKVSIKDVKHPTDKVNVVYTVDLSNGNLTDGTNTINATYKYKQGDADFAAIDGTTKVTVYANKTVTDSLVNVTANKDQWNAAPAGTYTATVTFNFVSGMPVPAGAVYQVNDGATLKGDDGDLFPTEPNRFDTLTYGDYVYTYNHYSLFNTWEIVVADTTKSEYGSPLPATVIAGKPVLFEFCFADCGNLKDASNIVIPEGVTDLYGCFDGCSSLETAPVIPSTVTGMCNCFFNCSSLKTAPVIPSSVTDMCCCFTDCSSLETAPVIPESVKNLEQCFVGCSNLRGDVVINANPDNFEGCFERVADDGNINLIGSSTMLVDIAKTAEHGKATVNGASVWDH